MLDSPQKAALIKHVEAITPMLEMTPKNGADAEAATLVILTKGMKVLSAQKTDSFGYEARAEAYLIALDDVPFWATDEALRKWYRGEHGHKFDYQWMPAPADLRKLAMNEVYLLRARLRKLMGMTKAVALMEFDKSHEQSMKKRVDGLFTPFKSNRSESRAEQ
jgi:hypothetical protein